MATGIHKRRSGVPADLIQPDQQHSPTNSPSILITQMARLGWLARVLYLFTKTDVHNLVLPACTLNLVVHAMYSSGVPGLPTLSASTIALSCAKTFLWGYLGLLVIDVTNQLMGQAEDRLNKPFRPLVSGQITVPGAMRLAVVSTGAFVVTANALGVLWTALSFVGATATYNFTGADRSWVGKNLSNAWGYGCFFAAGAWIAVGDLIAGAASGGAPIPPAVLDRLMITAPTLSVLHAANIFCSITIQDLRDVDGDLQSRRTTHNLAWGERAARMCISAGMSVFTAAAAIATQAAGTPWSMPRVGLYAVLVALVAWIGVRILLHVPEYLVVVDPVQPAPADTADSLLPPLAVSKWIHVPTQALRLGVPNPKPLSSLDDSGTQAMVRDEDDDIRGPWVAALKREQAARDDVSFKLYILWLYLYIFTAVV
ncbi:UbiA prenyltransferase family-domain-containing protein [Blastocladiella britannica]|nr:UbiA prenyltransferase family-domain-containing protein [Blastocladiella britannica]